jgi:hypothetical protein
MRRRIMMRGLTLLVLLTVSAGCDPRSSAHQRPAPTRVGELLYAENLIADPEVSAKMAEFVVRIDSAGALPESVLPEVQAWLEAWTAAHPERAARARMMPRPSR